ncbi:MAG: DUF2742 domain-containing protein [Mycobacterium sp.]
MTGARQVSWWSVHEWVRRYLDTAGDYPMAGTPAWCLLPDDAREKWAALLDFAQHHALRVETTQQAQADASKQIAAAADWSAVARETQQMAEFRHTRPWMQTQRRSA